MYNAGPNVAPREGLDVRLRWREGIKKLFDKAEPGKSDVDALIAIQERWRALSRYDDDIREATEKLRPFGEHWVNELARAYFALNEDRDYLPNIVSRLLAEAEVHQRQTETQRWATVWRRTADGELCTEESRSILRQAEAHGFSLSIEDNNTFVVTKQGFGTTYLRSNYEIRRFGEFHKLLMTPNADPNL